MKRTVLTLAVAVLAAVACSSTSNPAPPATTAPASTTTLADLMGRRDACRAALDSARTNVATLLNEAPGQMVAGGSPAAGAADLRARAKATREIVENARAKCASTLPECPAAADEFAAWLKQGVDSVDHIADVLVGSTKGTDAPLPPRPAPKCLGDTL